MVVIVMNSILQLKGRFEQRSNANKPGTPTLPKTKRVTSDHLRELKMQLTQILEYWKGNRDIAGAIVSVHYKHIVAKSNRLRILLSESKLSTTDSIRGAKFEWDTDVSGKQVQRHVFTHYVPLTAIERAISLLEDSIFVIDTEYGGVISSDETDQIGETKEFRYMERIAKTNFLKVVLDGLYVSRFDIDRVTESICEESIVTIYRTGIDTKNLLAKFGISIVDDRIIDQTTIKLFPDEMEKLLNKANYLIAMSLTDFSKISHDNLEDDYFDDEPSLIPHPRNEPTIGVIDTQFDESVYFHEWVEYHNMLDDNIPLVKKDYYHGTAVSSIIVDGPRGNPNLEDGCGHFKVRHFGVATHGGFSSFAVLKLIRQIVAANHDIKVWNLSLGSRKECDNNFISPEAAELDRIQTEYDVVFVVAGTNKPDDAPAGNMRIGAPADSLNSLVVNAVDFNGKAASYTRIGPVLSFFNKPDISYYGGDGTHFSEKMVVCQDSMGAAYQTGTSFSAPWISRKLAYLIHVMGLSREIAKAILIDSAAGWNRQDKYSSKIGFGIVPKHIDDIIHSSEDEIRFVMTGTAEEYETYTYNLPVPVVNNFHPFYARATLAYFPECDRNQGVDYTCTEMDIHFGRVAIQKGKAGIKSIDDNKQSEEGLNVIYEEDARKMYRKWDNIKHISEVIKKRAIPRKAYEAGMWGLSIRTKERMKSRKNNPMQFGVVVTLKEMNGVNRIDDFIKLCMAKGWLVYRIDVQNQIDIYLKAEEEIEFE